MNAEENEMLATNNSRRRVCKEDRTDQTVGGKPEARGKAITRFYENYKDYCLYRSPVSSVTICEAVAG